MSKTSYTSSFVYAQGIEGERVPIKGRGLPRGKTFHCQIWYSENRSGTSTSQSGFAFLILRSNSPRSILVMGGSANRGGEKYGRGDSLSGRNISSQWLGMTSFGWTFSIIRAYQRSPDTARQITTSASIALSTSRLLQTSRRLPWKVIRKLRQESMQ